MSTRNKYLALKYHFFRSAIALSAGIHLFYNTMIISHFNLMEYWHQDRNATKISEEDFVKVAVRGDVCMAHDIIYKNQLSQGTI
jgi:hypothetical protein